MLEKRFLKTNSICQVTFSLAPALQGETVFLVGDFNQWDESATPMKQMEDGRFTTTLNLDKNRDYQFRYLVNGVDWHNDVEADKFAPNPYSGDNSVVSTET